VRFGLGLASDLQGDAFFNVAGSYRRTWINELGGEWRTDAQIGERVASPPNSITAAGAAVSLVAPNVSSSGARSTCLTQHIAIARYDIRGRACGYDLSADLREYGEVRAGVLSGW
jgi:NTE family protein